MCSMLCFAAAQGIPYEGLSQAQGDASRIAAMPRMEPAGSALDERQVWVRAGRNRSPSKVRCRLQSGLREPVSHGERALVAAGFSQAVNRCPTGTLLVLSPTRC